MYYDVYILHTNRISSGEGGQGKVPPLMRKRRKVKKGGL